MSMRLEEFKELNKSIGNYWFSPDSMRFFKSRILDWDIITGYFITSEKGPSNVRRYSIRRANFETGTVSTVSEFQEYPTLQRARTAYKRYLRGKNK
jgi:hypothetical protein